MPREYDGPKYRARRARAIERAKTMAALYREGWTLARIGEEFGISKQAVDQHFRRYLPQSAREGGQAIIAARNEELRYARRDARYLKKYGCTYEQRRAAPRKAKSAFAEQRCNAGKRRIGWDLTFWEWWMLWQRSGHWGERGRGQGYVMCRRGDVGPYSVDNVYIAPARHNNSLKGGKIRDLPMGVYPRGNAFFASRILGGRKYYLGTFPTPGLAHAAYLQAGLQYEQEQQEAA